MKKIVLTGGGTAGHVTPNIALLPRLREEGYQVEYIGSYHGMEKGLVQKAGLSYHGISSGKLRRYFSLKNATDVLRVAKGYFEALFLLKQSRLLQGRLCLCPRRPGGQNPSYSRHHP